MVTAPEPRSSALSRAPAAARDAVGESHRAGYARGGVGGSGAEGFPRMNGGLFAENGASSTTSFLRDNSATGGEALANAFNDEYASHEEAVRQVAGEEDIEGAGGNAAKKNDEVVPDNRLVDSAEQEELQQLAEVDREMDFLSLSGAVSSIESPVQLAELTDLQLLELSEMDPSADGLSVSDERSLSDSATKEAEVDELQVLNELEAMNMALSGNDVKVEDAVVGESAAGSSKPAAASGEPTSEKRKAVKKRGRPKAGVVKGAGVPRRETLEPTLSLSEGIVTNYETTELSGLLDGIALVSNSIAVENDPAKRFYVSDMGDLQMDRLVEENVRLCIAGNVASVAEGRLNILIEIRETEPSSARKQVRLFGPVAVVMSPYCDSPVPELELKTKRAKKRLETFVKKVKQCESNIQGEPECGAGDDQESEPEAGKKSRPKAKKKKHVYTLKRQDTEFLSKLDIPHDDEGVRALEFHEGGELL